MFKTKVADLSIYRWRYKIGYALISIALLSLFAFMGLNIPGGISTAEMQSVITSDNANISNLTIDNYPYHILQKLSLNIFGLTLFGIKLPSIIFGILTIISLIVLLRKWYKPNVGVLATLIAITTGQFIFISQNGTPDIMNLFWPVILMTIATIATNKETKHRKTFAISFCVIAALSLYTPLTIYSIAALVCAVLLHPHLRFLLRSMSRAKLIIGAVIFLIISSPVFIHAFANPSYIFTLLGIPNGQIDIAKNINTIMDSYFNFSNPNGNLYMTPVFGLGSVFLALIGMYQTLKTRASAKSYIINLSIICLIPAIILNPSYTPITFLPLVILIAAGIRKLLSRWYGLFPLNPYARVTGLIPIVILVSVLIISGINHYMLTYLYNPKLASNFSNDLHLIPKNTDKIVVTTDELSFYKVLENHSKIKVSTEYSGETFLTTRTARTQSDSYTVLQIITNSKKDNSDRFYSYKKTTN